MSTPCGWLISKDPARPCVLGLYHNDKHRDVQYFGNQRKYRQGYRRANLERRSDQQREYRRVNNARYKSSYMGYYRDNAERAHERSRKRRALKLAVPHAPWTKPQLLELYGSNCWLCYKPLPGDWHADHVIPISRGGWDVPTNLRPSCPHCNWSKNNRLAGDPVVVLWALWSMSMGRLR